MSAHHPSVRTHPGWGWFCIVLGLFLAAIAAELWPVDATARNAPMWVMFLCGVVFIMGGAMMLVSQNSKIHVFCAALFLMVMGTIGAWVALFGTSAAFSGGIPFLPHEYNVTLARWAFGCGALVSLILSVYAVRTLFKPRT